ncbi:MAG: CDP-glucose 4,6-dehydratase [Gammaproteobacteria bacterium]
MFSDVYSKCRVLVTGHTGFKGSWLSYWLVKLGAEVSGISLAPTSSPNHFQLLNTEMKSLIADIRDLSTVKKAILDFKPDIVFHLAAQALVGFSYRDPVSTYSTNLIGTLNVFEACRDAGSVRAIVNITSDKCYENLEQIWGYRETDRMGGYDMYSSSKACSEIMTNSYRSSFLNIEEFGVSHNTLLASARAGNVIGGGDWACDRLIPDLMKGASAGEIVVIRSPQSTRPWQHVLEPLSGYLLLGSELLKGNVSVGDAWNFGPSDAGNLSVQELVKIVKKYWTSFEYRCAINRTFHEAKLLRLDCSKASHYLDWKPTWGIQETIQKTTDWYRLFYDDNHVNTDNDLKSYMEDAKSRGAVWTT